MNLKETFYILPVFGVGRNSIQVPILKDTQNQRCWNTMTVADTFLSLAIKLAEANQEPRWKLAAVAVSGGRVLSVGLNCIQQNGSFHHCHVGKHAETEALRRCSKIPKTMYVARVNRHNITKLARPCEPCYNALIRAGVKRIVYTTNTSYGVERL